MDHKHCKCPADELGYIWLDFGEDIGTAECGCHVVAEQGEDGAAFHICDGHGYGPEALITLQVARDEIAMLREVLMKSAGIGCEQSPGLLPQIDALLRRAGGRK